MSYEIPQQDFVFLVRHLWLTLLAFSLLYPPIAALSAFAYRSSSEDGYRKRYLEYLADYGLVATSLIASASLIYVFWGFLFLPLPVFIYALYQTGTKKWITFFVILFELTIFVNLFEPIAAFIETYYISHNFSTYWLSIITFGAGSFLVFLVYLVMLPKIAKWSREIDSGPLS